MIESKLYFDDEEVKRLLRQSGYDTEDIKTVHNSWDFDDERFYPVEEIVSIAYYIRPDKDIETYKEYPHKLRELHGFENIFTKLLRSKLLEKLF